MATNGGASWFQRLFSRSKSVPLDPARTDLVVVASSFDDAESASSALDRAAAAEGWIADQEAVFRHHLLLPSDTVDDAAETAAQDGYILVRDPFPVPAVPAGRLRHHVDGAIFDSAVVDSAVSVTLQRVQVVDALHCSQERSRMAGLAQRRGGIVLGWDTLQPGANGVESAD